MNLKHFTDSRVSALKDKLKTKKLFFVCKVKFLFTSNDNDFSINSCVFLILSTLEPHFDKKISQFLF